MPFKRSNRDCERDSNRNPTSAVGRDRGVPCKRFGIAIAIRKLKYACAQMPGDGYDFILYVFHK